MKNTGVSQDTIQKHIYEAVIACLMTPIVQPHYGADPGHVTTVWGMPLMLMGPFGIAKTSITKLIAARLKLPHELLLMSSKEPVHFYGAPMPGAPGHPPVIVSLLRQLNVLMDYGYGVLVCDEVSSANENVQAALMGVVNERLTADNPIPNGVRFMLTANPSEIAANGSPIHPGLINRLCKIHWDGPTNEQWGAYMAGEVPDLSMYVGAQQRVMDNWSNSWGWTAGMLQGFLKGKGDDALSFQNMPDIDKEEAHEPWPSRRSWTMGMCTIATCRALGMPAIVSRIIFEGVVGVAASNEFFAYIKDADLPSPTDVLSGKWKGSNRLDIIVAVCSGVRSYMRGQASKRLVTQHEAIGAWLFIRELGKTHIDFATSVSKEMLEIGYAHKHSDPKIKEIASQVCVELKMELTA